MLTTQEFTISLKKYFNKYFTSKQAVHVYCMEKFDIEYKELKYQNENLTDLLKEARKTVFTLLKDMEKANIIEKYNKKTWMLI